MKTAFAILLIIAAVIACGCTTAAPSGTAQPTAATPVASPAAQTATAIPDLTGTWTGTAVGYDEGIGFSTYNNGTITMVVTEQKGRLAAGHFTFVFNGTTSAPKAMAIAISPDGKTFSLVEKDSGYSTGRIVSATEIELTYYDDQTPYSIAIDSLKRV